MQRQRLVRRILAGLAGGFAGNGVLGALFSARTIRSVLYDPKLQSQLFIDITPKRNIPVSVAGLVLLSSVHGVLFDLLSPAIPGRTWMGKGLFWGLTIWLMYWLFQEWFVYNTLLREPLVLNALELAILFVGSAMEGLIIAFILRRD